MANIEDGDSFDGIDNGEVEEEVPKRKMISTLKVWGHFFLFFHNRWNDFLMLQQ